MASTGSPTGRAFRLLEMLYGRRDATALELATRLGVSERAVRRYVDALRDAGVPIESSRGPYGGYRLGKGARLPPVVFSEEEALGLAMAVMEAHPAATGPEDLVGSALDKVIRALPEFVGRQAAALREYAAAAPDHRRSRPDPTVTSALVFAVAEHREIALRYRSESGNEWVEEVDPLAVVVRHGHWYLLCRSHRADALRTYRVDRVRTVVETARTFNPPEERLDPVAALEESLGEGWSFPTRVVFEASMADVSPWIRRPMGRLRAHRDGCVLEGSTDNPAMYAQEWLAPIPFSFRVEGGDELRAAVAALAARCAAAVSR